MADTRLDLDIQKFIHARENGKLSTRHRKLVNSIPLSAQERADDLTNELSDSNMAMLDEALGAATNPTIKKILEQEKTNIMMLRNSPQAKESPQQIDTSSLLDQIGSVLSNLWSKK